MFNKPDIYNAAVTFLLGLSTFILASLATEFFRGLGSLSTWGYYDFMILFTGLIQIASLLVTVFVPVYFLGSPTQD